MANIEKMAKDEQIDREIEGKFIVIDKKLKDAFSKIKKDIKEVKDSLDKADKSPIKVDNKEIEEKLNEISANFEGKIESLQDNLSKLSNVKSPKPADDKECLALLREIGELKVELEKQKQRKNYEGSLSKLARTVSLWKEKYQTRKEYEKQIESINEKHKEFEQTLIDKAKDLDKIYSKANENAERSFKEYIERLENEKRSERDKFEDEKANIFENTQKEIKQLRKEFEKKNEELLEKLSEKDNSISDLQKKVDYLNDKLSNTNKAKASVKKEGKGFWASLFESNPRREIAKREVQKAPFKLVFPSINEKTIEFFLGIVIALIIILGIFYFATPTVKLKYSPLDVTVTNNTWLPMDIYWNQNQIFQISGWESKLQYGSTEKRLTGTGDSISWFFNDSISANELFQGNSKGVFVSLSTENKTILNSNYNFTFWKNNPYFKVRFKETEKDKVNQFAYGLIIKGFDIYSRNGTISLNDHQLNGTILSGSEFTVKDANYEIFNNNQTNISIIFYSPNVVKLQNSFYWNVYWVYVHSNGDGTYPPLYVMVLENAKFNYDELKGWQVKSKQFSGDLEDYINKSVSAMN